MTLVNKQLVNVKKSVSNTDRKLLELQTTVEDRIAQLKRQLAAAAAELSQTKGDLRKLQLAVHCMGSNLEGRRHPGPCGAPHAPRRLRQRRRQTGRRRAAHPSSIRNREWTP